MSVEMTGEAKARVGRHLDAVEKVLAGKGMSREERRGVVDDLEAQIGEMAAVRGSGELRVVEEVLGKLDVPEKYGEEKRVAEAGMGLRRRVRGSKAGKAAVGLGLGAAVAIGLFTAGLWPREWEGFGWGLGIALGVLGLGFGVGGMLQKQRRRGMEVTGVVINGMVLGWVALPIVVMMLGMGRGPAGKEVAWGSFWAEVDAHGMVSVEVWNGGTAVGVEKSGEKVKAKVPEGAMDPAGFKVMADRVMKGGAEFSYKVKGRFW